METPDIIFILYIEFGKHFWDSCSDDIPHLNDEDPIALYFCRRIVHTKPYYTEYVFLYRNDNML